MCSHEEATLEASNQKQKIVFPRRLGKGSEARLGGRDLGAYIPEDHYDEFFSAHGALANVLACFMRVVELVLDGLVDNIV